MIVFFTPCIFPDLEIIATSSIYDLFSFPYLFLCIFKFQLNYSYDCKPQQVFKNRST